VPEVLADAAPDVTRRCISIAEAAEYFTSATAPCVGSSLTGELTGYRAGKSSRLIRVDLDEIDDKLMQPIGFHWDNPAAKPRKRDSTRVPDRSPAVKGVEETVVVANIFHRKPVPQKRSCKCGHTDAAHGLRTTVVPGTINPPTIGVCWTCGCAMFEDKIEPKKRGRDDDPGRAKNPGRPTD
jgi:hypothetical protein